MILGMPFICGTACILYSVYVYKTGRAWAGPVWRMIIGKRHFEGDSARTVAGFGVFAGLIMYGIGFLFACVFASFAYQGIEKDLKARSKTGNATEPETEVVAVSARAATGKELRELGIGQPSPAKPENYSATQELSIIPIPNGATKRVDQLPRGGKFIGAQFFMNQKMGPVTGIRSIYLVGTRIYLGELHGERASMATTVTVPADYNIYDLSSHYDKRGLQSIQFHFDPAKPLAEGLPKGVSAHAGHTPFRLKRLRGYAETDQHIIGFFSTSEVDGTLIGFGLVMGKL